MDCTIASRTGRGCHDHSVGRTVAVVVGVAYVSAGEALFGWTA
jgi:hypothetical protein